MNYPLAVSENAIITVAERGYYESYTVYSLAALEDSQIIETPFARRKKSPIFPTTPRYSIPKT